MVKALLHAFFFFVQMYILKGLSYPGSRKRFYAGSKLGRSLANAPREPGIKTTVNSTATVVTCDLCDLSSNLGGL